MQINQSNLDNFIFLNTLNTTNIQTQSNFENELNLSLNQSNLKLNLVVSNTQQVSQISNLQPTDQIINQTKFNSAYGYSVDENGFMGKDFNKAANLPENFRLHKSTIDA